MTIVRYAGQAALVIGAFWVTLSVDAGHGQRILVDAAQSGAAPKDLFVWVLVAIGIVTSLSVSRYRVSGFPATFGAWCESHRAWLLAMAVGGAALGVYCGV